jgi:hypothetical protein
MSVVTDEQQFLVYCPYSFSYMGWTVDGNGTGMMPCRNRQYFNKEDADDLANALNEYGYNVEVIPVKPTKPLVTTDDEDYW